MKRCQSFWEVPKYKESHKLERREYHLPKNYSSDLTEPGSL